MAHRVGWMKLLALAACGIALIAAVPLPAQTYVDGTIQGTVTDTNGKPVANAQIAATNTDTGVQTRVLSDSSGAYTTGPLQQGPYIVEFVAKGFERTLQENLTVVASKLTQLDIKL